jgi:hypothetical protein
MSDGQPNVRIGTQLIDENCRAALNPENHHNSPRGAAGTLPAPPEAPGPAFRECYADSDPAAMSGSLFPRQPPPHPSALGTHAGPNNDSVGQNGHYDLTITYVSPKMPVFATLPANFLAQAVDSIGR